MFQSDLNWQGNNPFQFVFATHAVKTDLEKVGTVYVFKNYSVELESTNKCTYQV